MSNKQKIGLGSGNTAAADLEPSGREWVSRYRGSKNLQDLRLPFRGYAEAFIGSLRAAGATVNINATYRPPKRAYLMHWAWKIAKGRVKVEAVPAMDGVPISWEHYDKDKNFSDALSVEAAREMVCGFQMERLGVAPSLNSRHTAGYGIDMTISWIGDLLICDAYGELVKIDQSPRTGMNPQLHRVGAGYGVIKYNRSGRDDPHWSDTGA
jgi:hypothetical protein